VVINETTSGIEFAFIIAPFENRRSKAKTSKKVGDLTTLALSLTREGLEQGVSPDLAKQVYADPLRVA
jgi:hypothetical protein